MSRERDSLSDAMMMIGAGVVGALLGGLVALLLAPKVGSELREELKKTATEAGERLSEATRGLAQQVKSKAEELGRKAQEAAAPEGAEKANDEAKREGA